MIFLTFQVQPLIHIIILKQTTGICHMYPQLLENVTDIQSCTYILYRFEQVIQSFSSLSPHLKKLETTIAPESCFLEKIVSDDTQKIFTTVPGKNYSIACVLIHIERLNHVCL